MIRILKLLALAAMTACLNLPAHAAGPHGSADEAVAMVKRAVAHMKKAGKAKAFADFADPANTQFHDRDLYIFVYDMDGTAVAHGNNPKMVGKNLVDMKDIDGKFIIRGFIDVAKSKGSGWVDYKWPNPVTKNVEAKSSYVEKTEDNLIVGAGIYK